jgi:hypothetical protein
MSAFESTVTDLLARGVAVRFAASGDSMHPAIRHGEHVYVAPVDWSSLRVGDVVLARAQRGLTAHRLVKVAAGLATTRGDNAAARDAAVSQTAIIGRITHVERDGATVAVPRPRLRVAARRVRRNLLSLSQLIRSVCEQLSSSSGSPRRSAVQCPRASSLGADAPAVEQRRSHLRER